MHHIMHRKLYIMRSSEMSVLSTMHKAAELSKQPEWHLNRTTLNQTKKAAFLINDLVLGVRNVSDGSAQTTLDALKAELCKLSIETESDTKAIQRIVSSTSDGASTQAKFNDLLRNEVGGNLVENKCSMHLGVNLRHACVKAINSATVVQETECSSNIPDSGSESMVSSDDENLRGEPKETMRKNGDIDSFFHEICKLFGHVGGLEYANGASTFKVFLSSMVAKEASVEGETYYTNAEKVLLKRQVGNRYYVTSFNAARILFLRRAMITFLKEQELIKQLNKLESTCLEKLQDEVLINKLRLEGLMHDKVYADLSMLVKNVSLNKTSLSMNVHYEELLEFFVMISDTPSRLLDYNDIVFKTEPRLYSSDASLNHRLASYYLPQRRCDTVI